MHFPEKTNWNLCYQHLANSSELLCYPVQVHSISLSPEIKPSVLWKEQRKRVLSYTQCWQGNEDPTSCINFWPILLPSAFCKGIWCCGCLNLLVNLQCKYSWFSASLLLVKDSVFWGLPCHFLLTYIFSNFHDPFAWSLLPFSHTYRFVFYIISYYEFSAVSVDL